MSGAPQDPTAPFQLGPYRILRTLGRGGMGEVLLAYDSRLDRRVAIKRVRADLSSPNARARFKEEAQLAAAFSQPAIVQVFDLFEQDGIEHIVMEYVAGRSLRQRLELEGPPPPDVGLQIAHHLAAGVAYAHARGVVHRDLKTENVLLSNEGSGKITDFGIACRLPENDDPGGTLLTTEGTMAGTCRAMSPEQICGDPLDERTDLFSFGVLLYELFTGQSPFDAGSKQETIRRVIVHRPSALHLLVPTLPPALGQLVAELLAKEPDQRPPKMDQVVERLEQIASGGAHVETRLSDMPQGESPIDSSAWQQRGARKLPFLTILAHPEIERIGMRAQVRELLAGERVLVSRLFPSFGPAQGRAGSSAVRRPLLESHLSRQPIILCLQRDTGSLLIDRAGSRTNLSVEGQRVDDQIELDPHALDRGVVFVLSHRVALWLHLFDPSLSLPASDSALLAAESNGNLSQPDDIARLFFHFLRQERPDFPIDGTHAGADGRPWPSAELVARLVRAPWPGQWRQLREVARKLAVLGPDTSDIDLEVLMRHDEVAEVPLLPCP